MPSVTNHSAGVEKHIEEKKEKNNGLQVVVKNHDDLVALNRKLEKDGRETAAQLLEHTQGHNTLQKSHEAELQKLSEQNNADYAIVQGKFRTCVKDRNRLKSQLRTSNVDLAAAVRAGEAANKALDKAREDLQQKGAEVERGQEVGRVARRDSTMKIDSLTMELASQGKRCEDEKQAVLSRQEDVNNLQKKLTKTIGVCDQLRATVDRSTEAAAASTAMLGKLETEKADTANELQKLGKKCQLLGEALKRMMAHSDALAKKVEELESRDNAKLIKEFEDKKEKMALTISQMREAKKGLQKEMRDFKFQIKQLEDKESVLMTEVEKYEKLYETFKKKFEECEKMWRLEKARRIKIENELKALNFLVRTGISHSSALDQ